MHLNICEYYLLRDDASLQLILNLFCVTEPQMEPESCGWIKKSCFLFHNGGTAIYTSLSYISSNSAQPDWSKKITYLLFYH